MNRSTKILVVDDEKVALDNLIYILEKEGYTIKGIQSGLQALEYIEKDEYDLILTDLKMEKVDGMQVLKRAKELYPDTEVIMITGFATLDSAINAMKAGAYHYIAKPFKLDEVRKVVGEALEKNLLKKENKLLKEQLSHFEGEIKIISNNQQMKKLLEMAKQAAATDTNIVISGESGTGKELIARFIHHHGMRSSGPLLSINCGAFSEELLTNELFGHEKGAFTGAETSRKGLVEMAAGGTLFLDEITEMPLSVQAKLLRVIQEKVVMRVRGTNPIRVNVRFVCATNRKLQQEVQNRNFRQDLFFRLNVVAIDLPPLSARKDDIPLLSRHFLKQYARLTNKDVSALSKEVLATLMLYDFPGNVRELENIIERGVALTSSQAIEMEHLPENLRGTVIQTFRKKNNGEHPTLDELERDYIAWVLKETNDDKTEAAKKLGIDRISLWRKIKKHSLGNNQ